MTKDEYNMIKRNGKDAKEYASVIYTCGARDDRERERCTGFRECMNEGCAFFIKPSICDMPRRRLLERDERNVSS